MNEIIDVIIRCILSLISLFLITKLLGKKQVSQLSLFDYVIGISIGNFAAEMSINLDSDISHGIIAVVLFGIVSYTVNLLAMKSILLRRYFMGTPTVVIENGNILFQGLKKVKFEINDLLQEARKNGYFDLSEISYAIVEPNGSVSFLPKGEYKPLTIKDMNLKANKQGLCANVIIDGKIMKENLQLLNKNIDWLEKELKVKGQKDFKKILLATLDNNEKLTIYEKNSTVQSHNVLE